MLISEELIRRIERSEAMRTAVSARAFGGDVLEMGNGVAAFCGEGNVATQAVGIHELSEEEFERVLAHYRGRCARFEFKLSPVSRLNMRSWVVRRADALPEFETILVRSLEEYEPRPLDADIRVVQPADARPAAERAARRFNGDAIPPGLVELIAKCIEKQTFVSNEVYIGGAPVAGCGFAIAQGVAWLSGASVEVEHRGKGLHKLMQAHRMNIAKLKGCSIICQGALPGSASQQNAQKNGFEVAFTRPTLMVEP